jgi:DeoR family glycerol-3-phosphate regulon repressor
VDFIAQFKVDHAVIGASALDEDGAMLDFDYREVRVAKAIMQNARTVMLVADSMKFTRTAPVRIGHLPDVDIFVTDRAPPEPVIDICRQNGVRLEVAEHANDHENPMEAAE